MTQSMLILFLKISRFEECFSSIKVSCFEFLEYIVSCFEF